MVAHHPHVAGGSYAEAYERINITIRDNPIFDARHKPQKRRAPPTLPKQEQQQQQQQQQQQHQHHSFIIEGQQESQGEDRSPIMNTLWEGVVVGSSAIVSLAILMAVLYKVVAFGKLSPSQRRSSGNGNGGDRSGMRTTTMLISGDSRTPANFLVIDQRDAGTDDQDESGGEVDDDIIAVEDLEEGPSLLSSSSSTSSSSTSSSSNSIDDYSWLPTPTPTPQPPPPLSLSSSGDADAEECSNGDNQQRDCNGYLQTGKKAVVVRGNNNIITNQDPTTTAAIEIVENEDHDSKYDDDDEGEKVSVSVTTDYGCSPLITSTSKLKRPASILKRTSTRDTVTTDTSSVRRRVRFALPDDIMALECHHLHNDEMEADTRTGGLVMAIPTGTSAKDVEAWVAWLVNPPLLLQSAENAFLCDGGDEACYSLSVDGIDSTVGPTETLGVSSPLPDRQHNTTLRTKRWPLSFHQASFEAWDFSSESEDDDDDDETGFGSPGLERYGDEEEGGGGGLDLFHGCCHDQRNQKEITDEIASSHTSTPQAGMKSAQKLG